MTKTGRPGSATRGQVGMWEGPGVVLSVMRVNESKVVKDGKKEGLYLSCAVHCSSLLSLCMHERILYINKIFTYGSPTQGRLGIFNPDRP